MNNKENFENKINFRKFKIFTLRKYKIIVFESINKQQKNCSNDSMIIFYNISAVSRN